MAFLTRWFGVTETEAERDHVREKADIDEIAERSLTMQSNAAVKQHRSLAGERMQRVFVSEPNLKYLTCRSGESALAERLAKGIFAKPGLSRCGAVCQCGRE